jgi:hypothetical protein
MNLPAKTTQVLNILFFASLATGLVLWLHLQKAWLLSGNWIGEYGVTEWLVNYQGGFVRRGLPGEFIFQLGRITGLNVGWIVICLSLAIYGIYFALVARASHRKFPFWGLCAAPLLGYPIYSGILIRKDIFLLLCLFLLIKIITTLRLCPLRFFLINTLSVIAILSHELFLFFGLPACIMADFMHWKALRHRSPGLGPSLFAQLATGWGIPLALGALVLRTSGNNIMALKILESWGHLTPNPGPWQQTSENLPGALSWLGRSPGDAISATQYILSLTHLGMPLWLLVILATFVAGLAITLLFRTDEEASLFSIYFLLQLFLMAPIYYSALDQGRWIFLHTNSAFIMALLMGSPLPTPRLQTLEFYVTELRTAAPPLLPIIAMAIWGFPHYSWSLGDWMDATPLLQIPARLYFP